MNSPHTWPAYDACLLPYSPLQYNLIFPRCRQTGRKERNRDRHSVYLHASNKCDMRAQRERDEIM